jgi:exopolysaccharide biosynthesis polyprenyl glycosylphosphotransferase
MAKQLIKRNWESFLATLIFTFDVILYNLALPVASYLRWNTLDNFDEKYYLLFTVINVFFLIGAALTGMYRGVLKAPLETQRYNMRRFTWYVALFFMSYLFLIKGHEYSRGTILIFLFVQYTFLDLFHSLFLQIRHYFINRGLGVKKTIIVGADDSALNFSRDLKYKFDEDYEIIGFLRNGFPKNPPKEIEKHIIGKYEDIDKILNQQQVDRIFVVSDSMDRLKYEKIRQAAEKKNIKLKMVTPQAIHLIKGAHIKDITGVPLTTDSHRYKIGKLQRLLKRSFDIVFASVLLLLLSPLILFISFLIKTGSTGPIIFKHSRSLFKGGKEFDFYKFRTMVVNADEIKEKMSHLNESNGALFKVKDDPRITKIGKLLRRYSLDELPQLFNVLKGDMSIVGPRPLPINDFDKIERGNGKINYDWYIKRGEVQPGITGLWQVSGRSKLSFEEMVMLDLYYIENQSIFFDLEILFETIPTVLTAKGAY